MSYKQEKHRTAKQAMTRANAEHGTPNYLDNLVAKPAKCASALVGVIKILALLSSNLGLTANSVPGAKKSDGSLSL